MNEDKYITILDEEDNETLAEVLFTFDYKGENFVLFKLVSDYDEDEEEVLAYKYEELEDGTIGNLIEISENSHEEWDAVEEMMETFAATNFEVK